MSSQVLAGDWNGPIRYSSPNKCLYIEQKRFIGRYLVFIDKETVTSYEVVNSQSQTSFGSGVVRGTAGAAVFGPIGAIAGAASAKKKSIYTVAINFKDGTRSLIELDDSDYKILMQSLF